MKTDKYPLGNQSNTIRLGNLLDDMWQVPVYFHKWQRHRYKAGLPYANYNASCAHLTELKRTTHLHWNALPKRRAKPPFRQAIQEELKRIDRAYLRFFNQLGGRAKIKPRHKFKSITLKQTGFKLLTLTFRQWDKGKWRFDKVPTTFHKHSAWHGKDVVSPSNVILVATIGFTS